MDISLEQKKQLLEKYSQDIAISNLSEDQKKELLLALGGENLFKKKDKIVRDQKTIKHLCQTKLQTLLLLEKQAQNPIETIDDSEYKNQYDNYRNQYSDDLQQAEKEGKLIPSKRVFDHVISDLSRYKAGSLTKKIKHARGLTPNFLAKNWKQEKDIDKIYLALDPEKVDISVIDFLKTGQTTNKKYTPAEELVLKQRLLDNNEFCKDILFAYQPLVIPQDGGYDESSTDRIVVLIKGDQKLGYLVSENMPIRYTEKHMRKYRGNEISFEVFADKHQLLIYLKNQLSFMQEQQKRFQIAIDYFTITDTKGINKENIESAYISFSTHGTFTDQVLTEKLEQLLSGDKRGVQQIIQAIITQANKGIQESKTKENIMREHYNAVANNTLF